jgi:hypothetical protein
MIRFCFAKRLETLQHAACYGKRLSGIAALPLLALPQIQSPAPVEHGLEPGARAPVAGLAGFETVSKIDFGAQQNRLTAVYVFPDRARWHFESYGAKVRSEHQYFYRSGSRVRELLSGGSSRELQDGERDTVLAQMELRRAVMLWPDGFDWEVSADLPANTRSAPIRVDTCCRKGALGSLVATLDGARPGKVEALDVEGPSARRRGAPWRDVGGRKWPRSLPSRRRTRASETVELVETRIHYLDLSFVPPDGARLQRSHRPVRDGARPSR